MTAVAGPRAGRGTRRVGGAPRARSLAALLTLLVVLPGGVGCCPEPMKRDGGAGGAADGAGGAGGTGLAAIQADIFDRHCVTDCHDQVSPSAGLRLNRGRSHGALVQRPSQQLPGQLLVAPGAPVSSYLIKKMAGQGGVVGDPMPRLAPPRPAAELERIRTWITRGAAND